MLSIQLELSIQALEKSDSQYASDSISIIKEIQLFEAKTDIMEQAIIARFAPVSNDLRIIISWSKIADQLQNIGDDIAGFSVFVNASLISNKNSLNTDILSSSIEIGRYILTFLHTLRYAVDTKEIDSLFDTIEADRGHEDEIGDKLKNELINATKNKSYDDALKIITITKLLESCPGKFIRIFLLIISNWLSDHIFRRKWISEAAFF